MCRAMLMDLGSNENDSRYDFTRVCERMSYETQKVLFTFADININFQLGESGLQR